MIHFNLRTLNKELVSKMGAIACFLNILMKEVSKLS